jgi:mannose-6-phosphate isomerase-like protein (cupin superfamily)
MNRSPTFYTKHEGIWVQWFGHPLRYLATASDTDGRYCLSVGVVDKDRGAAPHSHDFDEGFYILDGKVEFTAGNRTVLLEQGDFINVKAGTVHYPRGAHNGPSTMLVVAAPCGFDEFQIRVGGRIDGPGAPAPKTEEEMHRLVSEIAGEYGINMNPSDAAGRATPDIHITRKDEGRAVDVAGDRYRFLAETGDTGGAYSLFHATVGPGSGPPPHIHRREEEFFSPVVRAAIRG